MTESQIYEFINVHQGTLISLMQWWASVSFALVALAHFGRNSLHLVLVCMVLLLYVAFSLFAYTVFMDQSNRIIQLVNDLSALDESASGLSGISTYIIQRRVDVDGSAGPRFLPMWIALGGTFMASVSYVIYAYRAARRRA